MQDELDALEKNHIWDIVQGLAFINPIGCRWVYSFKLKPYGSLDRYKASVVALGNRQDYGIDYEKTFAPVAKINTIQILLAIAATQSWPLYQMDVKKRLYSW